MGHNVFQKIKDRDKSQIIAGVALGTGIGVVTPYLIKKYYDVPLPITFIPENFRKTSVIIPAVGGLVSLVGSLFTKNTFLQGFLAAFGTAMLACGIINGMSGVIVPGARFTARAPCSSCGPSSTIAQPVKFASQIDQKSSQVHHGRIHQYDSKIRSGIIRA